MTDAGEDGIDGASAGTTQEVTAEMAVGLHVADDRLDGGAPAEFAADRGSDAPFLLGDEEAGSISIVATMAAIDLGVVDGNTDDPLGLCDLRRLRPDAARIGP